MAGRRLRLHRLGRRSIAAAAAACIVASGLAAATAGPGWVRVFGGDGIDVGLGLAADAAGGVVVSGGFQRSLTIGPHVLRDTGDSEADYDGFIARLDGTGTPSWARQVASPNAAFVRHVVVDGDRILATGYAGRFPEGSGRDPVGIDLGGGPLSGNGGFDAFFAVYAIADGAFLSGRVIGGTGDEQAIQVVALPDGEAAILGQFTESFEGRSARGRDIFVVRLRPDGSIRWIATGGGPEDDEPGGMAALPNGDVVVTGTFARSFRLVDVELNGGQSAGFVARLAGEDGSVRWGRTLGEANWSKGAFVASSGDDVIVAGEFESTIRVDGTTLSARGAYDALLLSVDVQTGSVRWSCRSGGDDDEHPLGLAVAGATLVLVGAEERPDRTSATDGGGDRRRVREHDSRGRHNPVGSRRIRRVAGVGGRADRQCPVELPRRRR